MFEKFPALRVLIVFIFSFFLFEKLDLYYNLIFALGFLIFAVFIRKAKSGLLYFLIILTTFFRLSFSEQRSGNIYRITKVLKQTDSDQIFFARSEKGVLFKQYDYKNGEEVYEGDLFFYKNKLQPIKPPDSLSGFIYADYLKSQGVDSIAYLKKGLNVIYRGSTSIRFLAQRFRKNIVKILLSFDSATQESKAFLIALLTGEKSYLTSEQKQLFRDGGVVHVLAISGLHVGVFYLVLSFVFLKLLRLKPKLGLLFILQFLLGYAFLSGLSPSVIRATIMFALIQAGHAFNKEVNTLNIVFGSAILMLFWDPYLLFDIGFQLSYCAVIGILVVTQYSFFKKIKPFKYLKPLWTLLLVNLGAFLFTLPLLSYHFGELNFTSFWTSYLVVPLVGIAMYLGIAILVLNPIIKLAELVFVIFDYLYVFIVKVIDLIIEISAFKIHFQINVFELFFFFTVLLFCFTWKRILVLFALGVGVLMLTIVQPNQVRVLMRSDSCEIKVTNKVFSVSSESKLKINNYEFSLIGENLLQIQSLKTIKVLDFNVDKYQYVMLEF